ncbi:unnamed protein product, partial [Medioppia subpectinata]
MKLPNWFALEKRPDNDTKANGAPDIPKIYPEGALQVLKGVKVKGDSEFELDLEALSSILLRDSIRDKPVVVVSIAGDFRKGKSFMLNFFLRYLQSGCGTTDDWIGSTDELKGFSWRNGSVRDTTGILMWSEPFVIKLDEGQEVAILLMDTQGAFDLKQTVKQLTTVFALSTMISSIQVFNLMHQLQEDDLHVLQYFAEYGQLALKHTTGKPFQKLLFLIRDWRCPYEYGYGLDGGQQYLDNCLATSEDQEIQGVRRHIRSCFGDIGCYLMPYPGDTVATTQHFDGRVADIDSKFVDSLKTFVPLMLDPENVVVKEIGGRRVTGKEMMTYFEMYFNNLKAEKMPKIGTLFAATAEANNLNAVTTARDKYKAGMDAFCGAKQQFIAHGKFEEQHKILRQQSLDCFDNTLKMGGPELAARYRKDLTSDLDELYDHYTTKNKANEPFFGIFSKRYAKWADMFVNGGGIRDATALQKAINIRTVMADLGAQAIRLDPIVETLLATEQPDVVVLD